MKNPRNAGAKPKYQNDVSTTTIHRLVPTEKINEIDNAINKICEDLKTKKNV
jgi:hypothetical protein